MAFITATLVGDREVIDRLDRMPKRVAAALLKTVAALAMNLRSLIMNKYLSGPTGDHTLSVITGALRRSVKYDWEASPDMVRGRVFYSGDVHYAAIHEFGGTIHIPEIVPVRAKALHFFMGGREIFAMRVRAHDVHMPERAPMRTAFRMYQPVIVEQMRRAVEGAVHPAP